MLKHVVLIVLHNQETCSYIFLDTESRTQHDCNELRCSRKSFESRPQNARRSYSHANIESHEDEEEAKWDYPVNDATLHQISGIS